MSRPGYWDAGEGTEGAARRLSELKDDVSTWERIHHDQEELALLNELAIDGQDESLGKELAQKLPRLSTEVDELELRSWFTSEFDSHDAIVSIHPGAGGTESQDWADMILRMYVRWAQNSRYQVELNDVTPGEEAGIKNATFTVSGHYAYGFLQSEKGVHRLVRISPYDFSKRRHTSFASVDVIPTVDEEVEVDIDPNDLRIDTYRSTGAGGQHVNVTDSAVRITHMPTGITAQCQNDRSQHQNRAGAMKILRARLYERQQEARRKEIAELRGVKKEIAWGSQIRSYVLHPYSMAKDHRTDVEKGDVARVLNGDLDDFIVAFNRQRVKEEETV